MSDAFDRLKGFYPGLIVEMPREFTSHAFILRLAREHQSDYIDALYEHRDTVRQGTPVPFMVVHSRLAQFLFDFPNLVTKEREESSPDIFGEDQVCAVWKRR